MPRSCSFSMIEAKPDWSFASPKRRCLCLRRSCRDGRDEGASLASRLIGDTDYFSAARRAIPQGYCVRNETPHPHFLTADFALVHDEAAQLVPRLVEIQAFPSVFGYQALLCSAYREVYGLADTLGVLS